MNMEAGNLQIIQERCTTLLFHCKKEVQYQILPPHNQALSLSNGHLYSLTF